MHTRGWVLFAVAICVVVGSAALVVLPRPPRAVEGEAVQTPPRMSTADLYGLFAHPRRARSLDLPVAVSVEHLPDVVLPSGRLVATDAFVIGGHPFTIGVPAGHHPVSVIRADFADGDRRIAAAIVRFGAGETARWELALVPGQDPATLRPGEIFGYGVDSGTGAFTSPEAVGAVESEADYTAYSDELLAAMGAKTVPAPLTAAVEVDPATGANVVAFASGFGDGAYPTYAGFDASGRIVVVLTDFGVLDAPKG